MQITLSIKVHQPITALIVCNIVNSIESIKLYFIPFSTLISPLLVYLELWNFNTANVLYQTTEIYQILYYTCSRITFGNRVHSPVECLGIGKPPGSLHVCVCVELVSVFLVNVSEFSSASQTGFSWTVKKYVISRCVDARSVMFVIDSLPSHFYDLSTNITPESVTFSSLGAFKQS